MQPNDTLTSVKFSGAEGLYVRFDNTKAILGSGCISKKKFSIIRPGLKNIIPYGTSNCPPINNKKGNRIRPKSHQNSAPDQKDRIFPLPGNYTLRRGLGLLFSLSILRPIEQNFLRKQFPKVQKQFTFLKLPTHKIALPELARCSS